MNNERRVSLALTSTPMILIYVMVVFCVIAAIRQPAFLSPATLINLCRAGIFTMCFAICEMVVIISGGIDVSFPAIGCVAMYVPMYMYNNGMGVDSVFFFFGVAILIGLAFGILNGVLVAILKLPPLIATLATSSVASGGLIMLLGTREFTTLPPSLDWLYSINLLTYTDPATGFKYPLTILFLVPVILCIVVALVLRYTMLGRGLYAIGGDKNAARVAGFNVKKLQFTAYIFCSVMASATAMIYTIYDPDAFQHYHSADGRGDDHHSGLCRRRLQADGRTWQCRGNDPWRAADHISTEQPEHARSAD